MSNFVDFVTLDNGYVDGQHDMLLPVLQSHINRFLLLQQRRWLVRIWLI